YYNNNIAGFHETNRYVNQLYAVLRDTVKYYLKQRNPKISTEESNAFLLAVLAYTNQESYWSHFRLVGNKMKLLRGDAGYAYGIMQINENWHAHAVKEGKAWGLVSNIMYGMDLFYLGWQKAKKASCVPSANSWKEISRAGYSAYNGGLLRICRWTNKNDKWAKNDIHFERKYTNRYWEKYISDFQIAPSVNIECLAEGNENCSLIKQIAEADNQNQSTKESSQDTADNTSPQQTKTDNANNDMDNTIATNPPAPITAPIENIWKNQLVITKQQQVCIFKNNIFHCINKQRDIACLKTIESFSSKYL
ncbi:MAG: hypothetical protein GY756_22465, partial [bacterium]|nr:hypothetical protein [bacterium]